MNSQPKASQTSKVQYRQHFETAKGGILFRDAEMGIGIPAKFFVGEIAWKPGFSKDIAANEAEFQNSRRRKAQR